MSTDPAETILATLDKHREVSGGYDEIQVWWYGCACGWASHAEAHRAHRADVLRELLADALAAAAAKGRGDYHRGVGSDVDLSGVLSSNELCVAADRRAHAYDVAGATDELLARADADFVTAVERIVGTYCPRVEPRADPDDPGQLRARAQEDR